MKYVRPRFRINLPSVLNVSWTVWTCLSACVSILGSDIKLSTPKISSRIKRDKYSRYILYSIRPKFGRIKILSFSLFLSETLVGKRTKRTEVSHARSPFPWAQFNRSQDVYQRVARTNELNFRELSIISPPRYSPLSLRTFSSYHHPDIH